MAINSACGGCSRSVCLQFSSIICKSCTQLLGEVGGCIKHWWNYQYFSNRNLFRYQLHHILCVDNNRKLWLFRATDHRAESRHHFYWFFQVHLRGCSKSLDCLFPPMDYIADAWTIPRGLGFDLFKNSLNINNQYKFSQSFCLILWICCCCW